MGQEPAKEEPSTNVGQSSFNQTSFLFSPEKDAISYWMHSVFQVQF